MRTLQLLCVLGLIASSSTPAGATVIFISAPSPARVEHCQVNSIPVFMEVQSQQCVHQDNDGNPDCPTAFESTAFTSAPGVLACMEVLPDGTCLTHRTGLASELYVIIPDDLPLGTTFSVTIGAHNLNGVSANGSEVIQLTVEAPLLTVPAEAWAHDDPAAILGVDRDSQPGALVLRLVGPSGIEGSFASSGADASELRVTVAPGVAAGPHLMAVTALLGQREPIYPIVIHVPFALSLASSTLTVPRGQLGTTTVSLQRHPAFDDAVPLTLTRGRVQAFPLPPMVKATLAPSGAISVSVSAISSSGTADFEIRGTSGSLTRTVILRVVVP